MVTNVVVDDVLPPDTNPTKALGLAGFLIRLRLLLGLVGGITLGVFHHQSGAGLAAGIGLLYFVPIWYTKIVINADLDSKAGLNNIKTAGILNSVALMALVWITLFTWFHQDLLPADSPLLDNVDDSLSLQRLTTSSTSDQRLGEETNPLHEL
jgi:hypothetical protein